MALYKVIQDIEAEDKLLGPLTLRQFIYACIAAISLYLSYLSVSRNVLFFLGILLPVAGVAGFFAFPWSRDQPTEVWALAKIRFLLKPHRRIWDQSGMKELVSITAPKRQEHIYTDGLSQTEVASRLKALADTIDSRGWAVKNVNVNMYSQPSAIMDEPDSDRLIDVANLPQDVPAVDVNAADDIFQGNVADHFGQMITATSESHRKQIMDQLHQAAVASQAANPQNPTNDYWFMNQPTEPPHLKAGYTLFDGPQVVHPQPTNPTSQQATAPQTVDEQTLTEELLKDRSMAPEVAHLRVVQPLSPEHRIPMVNSIAHGLPTISNMGIPITPPGVTQPPDPAILGLANDNDKNVATIARMANEALHPKKPEPPEDEVVISLH